MQPNKISRQTIIKFNIVVLIALFIAALGGTPLPLQNDTFYTIKLGERIFNQGMAPIDTFTWHEGLTYTYPHWLYTILIYSIYNLGGYFGIYLSSVFFAYILGLVLYFIYLNLYKNLFISFLITIVVISMLSGNFTARAQTITYILFALQIFCIEKLLLKAKNKYGVYLILISICIVNIHAATWPLFFILFLPYFAEYIIAGFIKLDDNKLSYRFGRITVTKNKFIKKLFFIFIICLFTGLLSPIGDTPYTYLYKTYQGTSVKYIMEHQPLTPIANLHFMIFVGATASLLLLTRVKLRLSDIFMYAGLVLMALMSLRQATILYIVGGYFLCRTATALLENNNRSRINLYIRKIFTLKGGIAVLLFITLLNLNKIVFIPNGYDSRYPVRAVEYMVNNLEIETIKPYASYGYGSYLLFNNIKVFIDSRADLYTIQFNKKTDIFTDYVSLYYIGNNFRDILAKYPFTHLLLNREEKLYIILKTDPGYKEIYSDNQFVIYKVLK